MSFLSRLFGGARDTSGDPCERIQTYASKAGPQHLLRPAVAFGHGASELAKETAQSSTLTVFAVPDLDTLEHLLSCEAWKEQGVTFETLFAQSRAKHPGEAGKAIRLFRRDRPHVKTFYGAWDYDAEKAARRAAEYEADGILMPGIDADELYRYIFAIMAAKEPPPRTPEEHIARLERHTTKELSPFWRNAKRVQSEMY
jgi:hypothetical protein